MLVVGVLEWQTWHQPTLSGKNEPAAVARASTQPRNQTKLRPPPGLDDSSSTTAARVVTVAAATQPEMPSEVEVSTAAPNPPVASSSAPVQNEAVGQEGMAGDSSKAKLLRTALSKGDADASVSLANLYLEGKEVPSNCEEALRLLESAAEKANARARNRLAAMYEIGTCVQRDRVQAYRWLSSALAADRNNTWAQQNRDQTWRQMTPEERTMAEVYR